MANEQDLLISKIAGQHSGNCLAQTTKKTASRLRGHVKRLAIRHYALALLVSLVMVAAKAHSDSEDLHLKLVWRQQLEPSPLRHDSIFSKPSIIEGDFVVQSVIQDNRLLVFDGNGVLAETIPINPGATLSFSPANTASIATDFKIGTLPPGADDAPSLLTGFVNGQQAWQRPSFASSINLVADSGFSVELSEFIDQLRFFDSDGNLIREVLPFGSALPWSEERPAFATFSADGSTFVLLATGSDSLATQSVRLFVYDRAGNLKHSSDLPKLKLAQAVGISNAGSSLIVAWTDNPATSPQANVVLFFIDEAGTVSQQFTIPSIGFQVSIRSDSTAEKFAIDTGDGTIVLASPQTPPSFFHQSTGAFNAVAANAGLTAILSVIPKHREQEDERKGEHGGGEAPESDVRIQILSRSGSLLLERKLEGNSRGLLNPFVRLSKNGRFIAVQFVDEIRYYELKREGDL